MKKNYRKTPSERYLISILLLCLVFSITLFSMNFVSATIVKDSNNYTSMLVNSGGDSGMWGFNITSKINGTLLAFNITGGSTATHCGINTDSGRVQIQNGTLASGNCSFSPIVNITKDVSYWIWVWSAGSWTRWQYQSTFDINREATNIIFVSEEYDNGARTIRTKFADEIDSIWTSNSTSAPPSILSVNLTYPGNHSVISNSTVTFNATYSFDQINITNGTYYVWYYNSSIFNKTKVNVDPSLNLSTLIINGFGLGNYHWNIYSCGVNTTNTVCSWSSVGNYSFDVSGALIAENYSQSTYETASEKFMANFSMFPGTNFISVNLVYNGTSYVVSDIHNYGTSVELKRTIDIPLNKNAFGNETKQFYWSFIFSNSGLTPLNTSLQNQTVLPLNIVYCNSSYINSLNFTTYDETNPNPIINATFHTFWTFWTGSGTIKKNYSFEDTSMGNSSFKFCISPNQSIIHTNLNSEITSTGFFPRTYYLTNATINNITQEVPLRMINTSLGVKFFHTIRQGVARITSATVIISKFDVGIGSWVTVGIRQSDDQGQFIEYLELDKEYTYSITQNGNYLGSIDKTSTCSATPCMINLDIDVGAANLWAGYYDAFAPNVVYNLSYDKTTHNVTFSFVDTSGLATYFRLQVNKVSGNDTGTIICNDTLYATIGTIVCDLTGQTGNFVAKAYVSRSPEKLVDVLYGILNAIAEIIGKNDGLFFTLILVLVVGLIGAFNPVVGVLLAGLAFVFAAIMGLIMVSITSMILVVLLLIILIVKMGRRDV